MLRIIQVVSTLIVIIAGIIICFMWLRSMPPFTLGNNTICTYMVTVYLQSMQKMWKGFLKYQD